MLEILGQGGMGTVYKARQLSLDRLVAIKILPMAAAADELNFVERFKNEARTLAKLKHSAIVSVHDFGETSEGHLFIVMEFVAGTDAQKLIAASGRLPAEVALRIATQVCDALAYALSQGVIHRDIKPANVLLDSDGQAKVADFGLAKMDDPARTSALTRSHLAMGTPDFVAPETLSPGMVADHRVDLYALGVMLYLMLTGEIPRGIFKLPSQKFPDLDERFNGIIFKAMETDREERYQTALEVRRDLEAISTTSLPPSQVAAAKPDPQPPSPRRSKMLMGILGSLAVMGTGAYFWPSPAPSRDPS
ncbi:MAG: serine/threonine-protein kinase, partial [Prosthecobacter sp.]|nr:serine/threonine-protein kinase [Prosthecobacter sp.]